MYKIVGDVMEKIYIKYQVLVNGLPQIDKYKIDEFTLKQGHLKEEYFNNKYTTVESELKLNMNYYLHSCIIDFEKLTYNYFENDEFIEFEISNKRKLNGKADNLFNANNDIFNKIEDLEKKLRLILNIPLSFQFIIIKVFNENKEYLFSLKKYGTISFWNRLDYKIEVDELNNNSRFYLDYNAMKKINNNNFKRALEFYMDSFESEKISIRYILLFSSLESLFNLDSEDVTKKLKRYVAKILAEDNAEEYERIAEEINLLYDKRCKYVHGKNINCIAMNDEVLLRRYVRKVIITYWVIINATQKTSRQILAYLDSNKVDIQIKAVVVSLNSKNFSEQQRNLINLIEKNGVKIPDDVKANILSKCNDK